MIQQTARVRTKKNQGRSSGFQLCNAGFLLENPSHWETNWQESCDLTLDLANWASKNRALFSIDSDAELFIGINFCSGPVWRLNWA